MRAHVCHVAAARAKNLLQHALSHPLPPMGIANYAGNLLRPVDCLMRYRIAMHSRPVACWTAGPIKIPRPSVSDSMSPLTGVPKKVA